MYPLYSFTFCHLQEDNTTQKPPIMSNIGHKRNLSVLGDIEQPPVSKVKRRVIDLTDLDAPVVSGCDQPSSRIYIPQPTHAEISRVEKRFVDFATQFESRPSIQAFLRQPFVKTNRVTYTTDYEALIPLATSCSICARSNLDPNIWGRVVVSKTPNGFATRCYDHSIAYRMFRLEEDELCYRQVCHDCADDIHSFFVEGPVDRGTLDLLDTKVPGVIKDLIHAYVTDCRPK